MTTSYKETMPKVAEARKHEVREWRVRVSGSLSS